MRCAWNAFINILPPRLRDSVDKQGRDTLQELRLRINQPPELVTVTGTTAIKGSVSVDDLRFCINTASRYSPWTATTMTSGYLTAPGGHRIGVCGKATVDNSIMSGFSFVTSLCIRVARDFPHISAGVKAQNSSILIIGKPGSGKTTLLRDLIRQQARRSPGSVAVIDEREEIFPIAQGNYCFCVGAHVDVLSGCCKAQGIEAVLRCMGPEAIAVDEITAREDCEALLHAGWCGVRLLATAHAGCRQDLLDRPIYRPIIEKKLFDTLLVLHEDKTWHEERLDI